MNLGETVLHFLRRMLQCLYRCLHGVETLALSLAKVTRWQDVPDAFYAGCREPSAISLFREDPISFRGL
jgi:hypothetical protein